MPDIKRKVKEMGFTTQQIAEKLNISQQAASQAINGNPSLSRLIELADAMDVSVSELVSDAPKQDEVVINVGKDVNTIKIKIGK